MKCNKLGKMEMNAQLIFAHIGFKRDNLNLV